MSNPNKSYTSCDFEGKVVGGWGIVRRLDALDRQKGETGGHFSCCYIVEKEGSVSIFEYTPVSDIFRHSPGPPIMTCKGQSRSWRSFKPRQNQQ